MQLSCVGQFWHIPLLYLVVALLFASSATAYETPAFLGPYLLLLAEFLAGVLALRFETGHRRFAHVAVVAIALCGTFVVLVSLTTCAQDRLPANATCSLSQYRYALTALAGNFLLAAVIAILMIPLHLAARLILVSLYQCIRSWLLLR